MPLVSAGQCWQGYTTPRGHLIQATILKNALYMDESIVHTHPLFYTSRTLVNYNNRASDPRSGAQQRNKRYLR